MLCCLNNREVKKFMKINFLKFLTNLICLALYSQSTMADSENIYFQRYPLYTKSSIRNRLNYYPIEIKSESVKANYPENATFTGNVYINHGYNTLKAEQVKIYIQQKNNRDLKKIVTASGNIIYENKDINIKGDAAWINLNTKEIKIYHSQYKISRKQGRGSAKIAKILGDNRYIILENSNFTTCFPGDNSWSIIGSKIIYDRYQQIAKIWNARFRINNIPVFYSFYLQVPLGYQRRSGFMVPNIKYDNNNGFGLYIPYYINITNNCNATITASYMSKRGAQIQTELHYLIGPFKGLLEIDWIPNDYIYNSNIYKNNKNRWILHWREKGIINQIWRFNINYTKVSDINYFNDMNPKYGEAINEYIPQKLSIHYYNKNWEIALSSNKFQTLNYNRYTYCSSPQLDIIYNTDINLFNFKVISQATKFTNVNISYPETTRFHIEPTINFSINNAFGSLNTEAKLMVTHYQENDINHDNKKREVSIHTKKIVNRVIPQIKINAKTVFEKYINFSRGYVQTLEPQLQYVYVPYKNQKHIHIYDSMLLQMDYISLFRDHIYSGLDRIASLNQLTSSITTRIYNNMSVELFKASLGQIYYFSNFWDENVFDRESNHNNSGIMLWAGDLYYSISNKLVINGSAQCNKQFNKFYLGNIGIEYSADEQRLIYLNYIYHTIHQIKQTPYNISSIGYQTKVSKIGITAIWPFFLDRLSFMGSCYYNTVTKKPVEQLLSLQYHTCCWAVSFSYNRKISSKITKNNSIKYNNSLLFNIELRGLK